MDTCYIFLASWVVGVNLASFFMTLLVVEAEFTLCSSPELGCELIADRALRHPHMVKHMLDLQSNSFWQFFWN